MLGNRRAKNGAARATTSCSGSNQATYSGPAAPSAPSPPSASPAGAARKRTNACILCTSRPTALAMRVRRSTSGSTVTSRSRGSPPRVMRHSAR
jgi:hypothetical protein